MKRTSVLLFLLLSGALLFAAGADEAAASGPPTIEFVANNLIGEDSGLDAVVDKYFEYTGIRLEVIIPPHQQYAEKLRVIAASGDLPDVWQVWFPDFISFAEEGVNIPLDEYIADSQNVSRFDPIQFEAFKVDGKTYGVPFNSGGGTVTYLRKDWLDDLGMEVPTTVEELMDVARAFQFNDPDGNGRDDTIGYTSIAEDPSHNYWPTMLKGATFGFTEVNGEWVDGFTQPNMKEAVARIKQGYDEGWIDPEIFTNTTSTARGKFVNGQAGIFSYWSGAWGRAMQQLTEGNNPDALAFPLPPVEGVNYWNRVSVPESITTAAEDPEMVFDQFIDLKWDQGDVEFLFIHGVEGIHWEVQNGKYVKLPSLNDPERTFNKVYIHPEATILPLEHDPFEVHPNVAKSENARLSKVKQEMYPQGGEVYNKNLGDLQALRSEVFTRIIAGQFTIDEGYAHYEEMSNKLNIDAILEELNG